MEASGSGSNSPFYKVENDSYVKGKEYNMSARKLAAALWEFNGLKQHMFEHNRHIIKDDPATSLSISLARDQRIDRSNSNVGGNIHSHKRSCSAILQKLEIAQGLQTIEKLNSIESTYLQAASGMQGASVKSGLKEVSKSVIASKELVKVLFRIVSQEEQHCSSSRMTLVISALRVELERARLEVERLVQRDAEAHLSEAEARWKRVSSVWRREVEIERKLRRRAERLNKKLGMELADARAMIEGERRARQVLEHEFKQEAAKAREELDDERQMLQLADILREERVQMKLAEARYEYEEKTATLELIIKNYNKQQQQHEDEDEDGDEDEGKESELHSIELNMDNNNNSFPTSMDQVFKGRRSLSDNIQWETICLQRNTPSNFNGLLLGTSSKQSDENYIF